MARTSQKNRVRSWQARINKANKAYDDWNDKYLVDKLEDQYLGPGQQDEEGKRYVINKIFPTVEIGIPSLLFHNPHVRVRPRPNRADDIGSRIDDRAKLQQDTLNTFIQDPNLDFLNTTTLSLKESFFVFGVVEVGYTADLIDNPLLQKPELTEEEQIFAGLEKIPDFNSDQPEKLYLKRIPAKHCRVPANSHNVLERNDWFGYWEYVRIQDVKANPNYSNTSRLRVSGREMPDMHKLDEEDERDGEGHVPSDMIKVWKIWDLRTRKKYVFGDGMDKFFIDSQPYDVFPCADYRPHQILDQFYPLPPLYNWLHPQEEMNDIRNKRRIHRQRANRRYTYMDGSIDEDEIEKLEVDEDNVYAKSNRDDPLRIVPEQPLDPTMFRDEQVTDNDFREITNVGGEQRGEATKSTTATQANYVELNKRIRETYKRTQVGAWLARIATIMLKLIRSRMALPFWIKVNVDPYAEGAGAEAMKVAQQWMLIVSEDLGDLQLDITVDIESLSPLTEQAEQMNWMQVLALLSNPQMLAVLLSSDVMLKKTLSYFNVTSAVEIAEFKKAATQMLTMVMSAAAAQQGAAGGSAQGAAPGPTPGNDQIRGQLSAQMGGM